MPNVEKLLQVVAEKVKNGRNIQIEVDCFEDIILLSLDIVNCELLVSDFVEDHHHFKWLNVLIFACDKNGSHANDVHVTDLQSVRLVL